MFSVLFFFSSRRRHTRCGRDWSSDVCSSDLRRRKPEVRVIPHVGGGCLDEVHGVGCFKVLAITINDAPERVDEVSFDVEVEAVPDEAGVDLDAPRHGKWILGKTNRLVDEEALVNLVDHPDTRSRVNPESRSTEEIRNVSDGGAMVDPVGRIQVGYLSPDVLEGTLCLNGDCQVLISEHVAEEEAHASTDLCTERSANLQPDRWRSN